MANVNARNCPQCGAPVDVNAMVCKYCGESFSAQQQPYPPPQYQQPPQQPYPPPQYQQPPYQQPYPPQYQQPPIDYTRALAESGKSKTAAGLLAIFLGGIGVHKFYLRKPGMGILYILFCWTGIPALAGLIEGIIYLCSSDKDFYIQHVNT